jgi:hypothetical protein
MAVDLPKAVRNPISLTGIAIATAGAIVFLVLLALELSGQFTNPYAGLLVFVAVPAVFVIGLLIIPIGAMRQRKRIAAGLATDEWPVIDLRLPRTRTVILGVSLITFVNVLIVSLAAYGAVHHMESDEFCGQTCHTTMEPEWKAHQAFPHAQVKCVQCHVGPGAKGFVAAKANGTRQLWHVIINTIPKPVPAPVHTMPDAEFTCKSCHWDEKDHGDKVKVIREYADDETGTETATTLQMHVGGGRAAFGAGKGIHWHMNIANKVEYIATDAQRQTIPWVRLTDRNGNVKEFVVEGTKPEDLAKGERRTMDCMDCHNRPAHSYELSPERAVDNAIASGELPRTLPFARKEAVAAVKDEYPSGAEALRGIEARLRKIYAAKSSDPALAKTISAVQQIYSTNVFPAMQVKWGTYPNNIGHNFFNGCFRCHDESHLAKDGSTIKQDCETCHAMP